MVAVGLGTRPQTFTHWPGCEFGLSPASLGLQWTVWAPYPLWIHRRSGTWWASAVHCPVWTGSGVEGWIGPGRLYASPDHGPSGFASG